MARGNNGQKVFVSDKDYEAFLDQLRVVRGRYPFYLYAYALMPNHFHLLLDGYSVQFGHSIRSIPATNSTDCGRGRSERSDAGVFSLSLSSQ